jgi:hypothetical protein
MKRYKSLTHYYIILNIILNREKISCHDKGCNDDIYLGLIFQTKCYIGENSANA